MHDSAPAPVVAIRDLRVTFDTDRGPVEAVRGISLDLHAGRVHALVGESGSGKSVTGLTLMGLDRGPRTHVSGAAIHEDRDLLATDERELRALRGSEFGMVFQDPMTSLNPVHRIGDQIAETLRRNRSLPKRAAAAEAVRMLGSVGILDPERSARRYPHEFSGGMRQRVMIVMALACDPSLLIADEPTTALDVTVQKQVLTLMVGLAREKGTAVLLITHDLGVVAEHADDVSVIRHGELVEHGHTAAVLGSPSHPYTQNLLTSIPRLHGPRRRHLSPARA